MSVLQKFAICGLFNLIWSTIFIETWKRRSSEYCLAWGLFDLDLNTKPRIQFQGIPKKSEITNKIEIYYPK